MYTRILVPLDGSTLAEGVLPVARRFAVALQAQVHLLSIVDQEMVESLSTSLRGRYTPRPAGELTDLADTYLRRVAEGLGVPPEQVRFSALVDRVPEAIVAEAERQPDTLIAMSTHGRSGFGRFLLGSVADKVLHTTHAPLLLYRPRNGESNEATSEVATVVVPLDGSALAEQALPHVAALARALRLQVLLLRVTSPMSTAFASDAESDAAYYSDLNQMLRQEAEAYLAAKARQLKEQGLGAVTTREMFGYAASTIVDVVRETPGSFVAISTHGRSGLRRWALGSVANRVVANAGAPVLVIRPS
ncbi:MAG: universal stress protein [Chloroflexi bacterium]|nr:universal stress protein [Chloroflexota bacterium]